jgi:hypothetical protein
VAYLSRETVKWLKIWLEHAKIAEGPIFRRLIGKSRGRLQPPQNESPRVAVIGGRIGLSFVIVQAPAGPSRGTCPAAPVDGRGIVFARLRIVKPRPARGTALVRRGSLIPHYIGGWG